MVEGMKMSVVSLCEQMKTKFETGAYDAIVSDDTGGRIPTLLLSKIYKEVSDKEFPTLFVATGKGYWPKDQNQEKLLSDYLERGVGGSKKVLVVTQYLRTGETIDHLIAALKQTGVTEVEIAALEDSPMNFENSEADNIYVGGHLDRRQRDFVENHTLLSGISKSKQYSPVPKRLDTALDDDDTNRGKLMTFQEFRDFAGIGPYDSIEEMRRKEDAAWPAYATLNATPLSPEEKQQIQKNINRTRETINKLAVEIVEEIWPNKP